MLSKIIVVGNATASGYKVIFTNSIDKKISSKRIILKEIFSAQIWVHDGILKKDYGDKTPFKINEDVSDKTDEILAL